MKELAYYDGKIGMPDELTVPFNDRSHFFGDGVYDATVSGNHRPYLLNDHLDRFYTSAGALDIKIGMSKKELHDLIAELDEQVEGNAHFVYWQITRGSATRNHAYPDSMVGKLWVMIRPKKLSDPNIPVQLITLEDTRFLHCDLKTLNLLPSVMATQKAEKAGAFEAVLHRGDVVTECAHSNVSILKDGVFRSHPNDHFILRGISKTRMIAACYRLGILVEESPFTLAELMDADEVIVTSSTNFCLHASHINGVAIGGKDPQRLKAIENEVITEYLAFTGCKTIFD
jgi:D-alanine transaminase